MTDTLTAPPAIKDEHAFPYIITWYDADNQGRHERFSSENAMRIGARRLARYCKHPETIEVFKLGEKIEDWS